MARRRPISQPRGRYFLVYPPPVAVVPPPPVFPTIAPARRRVAMSVRRGVFFFVPVPTPKYVWTPSTTAPARRRALPPAKRGQTFVTLNAPTYGVPTYVPPQQIRYAGRRWVRQPRPHYWQPAGVAAPVVAVWTPDYVKPATMRRLPPVRRYGRFTWPPLFPPPVPVPVLMRALPRRVARLARRAYWGLVPPPTWLPPVLRSRVPRLAPRRRTVFYGLPIGAANNAAFKGGGTISYVAAAPSAMFQGGGTISTATISPSTATFHVQTRLSASPTGLAIPWRLQDPQTGEAYTFEVNPMQGGSPARKRRVTQSMTVNVPPSAIVIANAMEPLEDEIHGTIISQAQYNTLSSWFGKRHPVNLIDDLGRTMNIYITEYQPTRKRKARAPWLHDYTVKFLVLSVTEP